MDEWTDGRTNGQTEAWMAGQMDSWIDGQTERERQKVLAVVAAAAEVEMTVAESTTW